VTAKQLSNALGELLKQARNVRQYIGKLAADHDGDFLGRSASGALRKLQAAIDEAEAVQS